MKFEKKLIILGSITKARGTLSLERNAYGLFATLNVYNLPDIRGAEYVIGIKASGVTFTKELGEKGRILSRFEIPDMDINKVHGIVFDTAKKVDLLYGTAAVEKLWAANRMDGFRNFGLSKAADIRLVESSEDLYSGRGDNDIRNYFFDITPSERIEVPKVEGEGDEAVTAGAACSYNTGAKVGEVDLGPRMPIQRAAEAAAPSAESVQSPTTNPQPQISIPNPHEYNDHAVATVNYFAPQKAHSLKDIAAPIYSSRESADTSEFDNPVDQYLRGSSVSAHAYTEISPVEPEREVAYTIAAAAVPKEGILPLMPMQAVAPPASYNATKSAAGSLPELVFFEQIKSQIDELFNKNERFELLEQLMPETKWVRVSFDTDKFYVVGIVGKTPEYICYGVPSVFSDSPPEELGADCRWLPENMENPKGKGFWLMFQNAATGEAIG